MIRPAPHGNDRDPLDGGLGSFLRQALAELGLDTPDVRWEILFFNRQQHVLERVRHAGFETTGEALLWRYVPGDLRGGADADVLGDPSSYALKRIGICMYVALTGRSALVADVRFDARYLALVDPDDTRAELAVALLCRGDVVGVLNLESPKVGRFSEQDLAYLEERVAPVLARLLLSETRAQGHDFVERVNREVAKRTAPEEVLSALLDALLERLSSPYGCVFEPLEGGALRVAANRNLSEVREGDFCDPREFGTVTAARGSRRGAFWNSVDRDVPFRQLAPPAVEIHSDAAVEVRHGERWFATVLVESTDRAISERHREAIAQACDYAGAILDGIRAAQETVTARVLEGIRAEMHGLSKDMSFLAQALDHTMDTSKGLDPAARHHLLAAIQHALNAAGKAQDVHRTAHAFTQPLGVVDLVGLMRQLEKPMGEDSLWRVHLDRSGPEVVEVCGTQETCRLLLEELLKNSCQHAGRDDHGKTNVFVELHVDICDDDVAVMRYWDDGIAPDGADRILDKPSARSGLRIIRNIAEQNGWTVDTGTADNGSLGFSFRMPLAYPARTMAGARRG